MHGAVEQRHMKIQWSGSRKIPARARATTWTTGLQAVFTAEPVWQTWGITADSALVIDLDCPTQPRIGSDPRWQVPGSFLIVKDRDHLLAVWEGVFFELTRR
jgi:hypothetical protein